mmetsp:Transcript_41589/g.97727  ORF Transcript_41589/g.97727 Transcript_41589/m.97727 type:complete len:165 (-) Transcript_41589:306-800(-)
MLADVFAPAKAIERCNPHAAVAAAQPRPSRPMGLEPGPNATASEMVQQSDMRAMQLLNFAGVAHVSKDASKDASQDHAKKFSSPAERAAWDKFQQHQRKPQVSTGGRLDKPIHTAHAIVTEQNAALTQRSRRTADMSCPNNASRTDQTTVFHSTMLRALAHSHV